MIKPDLPPRSMGGCTRAAGVMINEAWLCGYHVVDVFHARVPLQKEDRDNDRKGSSELTLDRFILCGTALAIP